MNENNEIGKRIKELRKKKSIEMGIRYTGEMLAKDLNISRSYLGDIESGRIIPNEIILGKIADIFNTDIYNIIGEYGNVDIETVPDTSLSRVDRAIKKSERNSAIKQYIINTPIETLFKEIIESNRSEVLIELRKEIETQAKYDVRIRQAMNVAEPKKYFFDARVIKMKSISGNSTRILNALMNTLNFEIESLKDLNEKDKWPTLWEALNERKDNK